MNYFLIGSETYNLRSRKDKIIAEALGDDTLNLSVYRGVDWSMSEVITDCLTFPFLSDSKVVVIENPAFIVGNKENENEVKLLVDYLKEPNETTILIIYVDQTVDRRRSIIKTIAKLTNYETFDLLSEDNFKRYVMTDLNDNNIKLDEKSLNELFERLPINLDNWKHELEKLKLYPEKIDVEVIRALIVRPIEDDVFELSNAVVNKQVGKAIQIYRDLISNNKNDVKSLIGLLAYQFRFMCQVKAMNELGYTNKEIAEKLKAKDGRIWITLKNSEGKNSNQLLEILNDLAELDQNILLGKVEGKLGLELFIMERTKG